MTMHQNSRPNYDLLALDAMLLPNKRDQKKRLDALTAHAKGCFPCPDCGDTGPHHVQGDEFACQSCGMQHEIPTIAGVEA